MVLNTAEMVYPTRQGTGIIVKGKVNIDKSVIFDELCSNLWDFFDGDGLVVVHPDYDFNQKSYLLPVYDPEKLRSHDMVTRNASGIIINLETRVIPSPPVGKVSLRSLPPRIHQSYVKHWDFAHAPSEKKYETFLAYFNMKATATESADAYSDRLRHEFYDKLRPWI